MTSMPSTRRQLDGVPLWSITTRSSQHGRVLAEKGLSEEFLGAPDSPIDLRAGYAGDDSYAATYYSDDSSYGSDDGDDTSYYSDDGSGDDGSYADDGSGSDDDDGYGSDDADDGSYNDDADDSSYGDDGDDSTGA